MRFKGASPTIPEWEFTADFDPTSVVSHSVRQLFSQFVDQGGAISA